MAHSTPVTLTATMASAPAVSVSAADNGLKRTVTVNYTGSSQNSFAGVVGRTAWALSGSSQAAATVASTLPSSINSSSRLSTRDLSGRLSGAVSSASTA